MPSGSYQRNIREMLNGGIAYLTDTMRFILLATAVPYTYNADHEFVDAGGANDILDAETTTGGYTGGHGGASRLALASKTITANDTSNRTEVDCADPTFPALGGTTPQTLEAVVVEKPGASNDTTARPIAYLDPTNVTTNGGDITVQVASNGFLNFTIV